MIKLSVNFPPLALKLICLAMEGERYAVDRHRHVAYCRIDNP
jgi:hypothetical protein